MTQIFNALLYHPLFNILIFLVWLIPGHQVAWAIIILTLVIRIILLPVTVHTARVQARMRLIQPKVDELKQKHKDDKALQSQAMMTLYKEEGVSPFSSCLPLIVQLVILIVLYNVFRNGLNTNHFNLLYSFTPKPSSVNTHFFWLDIAKPDKYVLPILAGITQFWQTKITFIPSSNPNDSSAAISKQMLYVAPLITFIFARNLPAALPLYWTITSLFTFLQQEYVIKRQGLDPKSVAKSLKALQPSPSVQADKEAKEVTKEKKKGGAVVTVRKKS